MMDWGQEPADPANPGPYEFDIVYATTISEDRRIYVSDRARFQVFGENGEFQFMFPIRPRDSPLVYAVEVMLDPSGEEVLWIADGGTGRMLKYDREGNFHYVEGTLGNEYGHFNGTHSITTGQDGNLYISEVFAGRVQKIVPGSGAGAHKIVARQLREYY